MFVDVLFLSIHCIFWHVFFISGAASFFSKCALLWLTNLCFHDASCFWWGSLFLVMCCIFRRDAVLLLMFFEFRCSTFLLLARIILLEEPALS